MVQKIETAIQTKESPDIPAINFHITNDHLGEGGAKAKFRANMDAIRVLKELEFDERNATPEEQEILSQYVGWGGLAAAFDENKASWAEEFRELYTALSPEEYAAARASTLNAHYTSPTRNIPSRMAFSGISSAAARASACHSVQSVTVLRSLGSFRVWYINRCAEEK